MKLFILILICLFFASLAGAFITIPEAKDLPREVYIPELSECDGKRVTLLGWLQGGTYIKGRMGGNFFSATLNDPPDKVKVFAEFQVLGVLGNKAIVQGIYHKEGWYAGFLQEDFIVADAIVRDGD